MPRDLDGLADVVVLTVKTALAPLLERLALAEQASKDLQARVAELSGLRDRLVTVETKAALPLPVERAMPDLSPVLERMTAAEAKLATLAATEPVITELRDRVVVMETKAAQPLVLPPAVDLTPVLERVAGMEATIRTLGDVRDRVITIETKASIPPETVDLGPLVDRLSAIEQRGLEESKAITALDLKIAQVEWRVPTAGPQGEKGQDGKDGLPGKDGADGLGFDDLAVVQDDERTFTVKAVKGDRLKPIGTAVFPVEIYRGVFVENKTYERGDAVTWAGSEWHCNEETTAKPGDGSKGWTLKVKKGRDGRDGRDAPSLPVLSVGRS